jgi:hypothetical protein
MNDKNIQPGRFEAVTETANKGDTLTRVPIKVNAATRRLAVQLFGCLIAGACIALAHATGDMSTRLSLLLAGADLAAAAFNTGVWSQRVKAKGGERNG